MKVLRTSSDKKTLQTHPTFTATFFNTDTYLIPSSVFYFGHNKHVTSP